MFYIPPHRRQDHHSIDMMKYQNHRQQLPKIQPSHLETAKFQPQSLASAVLMSKYQNN
jgi:hypothetical protein